LPAPRSSSFPRQSQLGRLVFYLIALLKDKPPATSVGIGGAIVKRQREGQPTDLNLDVEGEILLCPAYGSPQKYSSKIGRGLCPVELRRIAAHNSAKGKPGSPDLDHSLVDTRWHTLRDGLEIGYKCL
jgi:hypothetical protein